MDRTPKTFLGRLASDLGGNTLAIAAASILALMGVIGGAVEDDRLMLALKFRIMPLLSEMLLR